MTEQTEIKTFYGNQSFIKENTDKYWQLEELTSYSPADMIALIERETGRIDIGLPGGLFVLMKLFTVAQETEPGTFALSPASVIDNARYNTRIGKVLAFGPAAFREKKWFPAGPTCEIGGYAMFNKYENQNFTITVRDQDDIEMALIADAKIIMKVENPKIIDSSRLIGR